MAAACCWAHGSTPVSTTCLTRALRVWRWLAICWWQASRASKSADSVTVLMACSCEWDDSIVGRGRQAFLSHVKACAEMKKPLAGLSGACAVGGRSGDPHVQVAQAGHAALQQIALDHGRHALGGAGVDQIARAQLPGDRQVLDGLGDVPDQLGNLAGLALLAVYLEPDRGLVQVAGLGHRGDGPDGCAVVEALADAPGASLLLHFVLQVAAGHVQAHGVAV